MKHKLSVTFILITLFFVAQIIGLFTIMNYISPEKTDSGTIISHPDTILGETPELNQDAKTLNFLPIIIAVLIGTALIFVLIKFKLKKFWKVWFFIAVFATISVSLSVFIPPLIAFLIALFIAYKRITGFNPIIHNGSEMFIYTGIAILILPWLNLVSATILLILISIYDMIAVWKSKHMIKLAEFQIESKMFAGLTMHYDNDKPSKNKKEGKKGKKKENAILGGGDIAFPLLFSAAVMEDLIISGLTKQIAFGYSLIISLTTGIALALLLFASKKGKFYPAMPFLSIGSFIGYAIIHLIV